MGTDIVVGIDGSENSKRALRWALDEAELRNVRVRAVLAWSFFGQEGTELGMGTTHEKAEASLRAEVDEVAGDRAHLVDPVAVNDLPVNGILSQCEDAGLIVVGSRGRGGVKGLLQGSVSRTVVERAKCPVVVLPHTEG